MTRNRLWASAALAVFVAGCAGGERIGGPLSLEVDAASPVAVLSAINENGQRCWFRAKSKDFARLALVPELDTRVGNPRLLVVERGKASGLPKLVIEASGEPVKITTYGPLSDQSVSARINDDVIAWSTGRKDC
ncbi:hypothetical protein [Oricola cellulosilytica]|uniref:Lipoprotein n=1 Tax=Oricola cellulosilytica TaxID=1429082 RepID=A0A4R0PBA6_9HYPH|nr:hypothetical protein [Oricola cellulosilytica]TCD14540.1 hypothetical protein E0D97_10825 [Oricola cellulosilytica]